MGSRAFNAGICYKETSITQVKSMHKVALVLLLHDAWMRTSSFSTCSAPHFLPAHPRTPSALSLSLSLDGCTLQEPRTNTGNASAPRPWGLTWLMMGLGCRRQGGFWRLPLFISVALFFRVRICAGGKGGLGHIHFPRCLLARARSTRARSPHRRRRRAEPPGAGRGPVARSRGSLAGC